MKKESADKTALPQANLPLKAQKMTVIRKQASSITRADGGSQTNDKVQSTPGPAALRERGPRGEGRLASMGSILTDKDVSQHLFSKSMNMEDGSKVKFRALKTQKTNFSQT